MKGEVVKPRKIMKHLKKIISMTLAITMAFAMVLTTNVTTAFAKSKVSSIKVVGAKKKVTMKVGAKKTYKVKVKASKKKFKGFTVKSSKKSIVAVKKKGTKFTLTAKKAGKAKITVKAKKNKKKKYVFTVTVKKDAPKPDTKPDVKTLFTVNNWGSSIFELTFDHEVDLTADMIKIMRKSSKEAKYIAEDKVVAVSTEDKKTYIVKTEYWYNNGEYALFAIPSLDKSYTVEHCVKYSSSNTTEEHILNVYAGKSIQETAYLFDNDTPTKLNKIEGVPEGLTYNYNTDGTIDLKGKIEKTGVYTIKAEIEDEESNIYNAQLVLVAGTDDQIEAYAGTYEAYGYDDAKNPCICEGQTSIYIAGGSGEFTTSLVSGDSDIFDLETEVYEDDEMAGTDNYITYKTSKPGTYKAVVLVEDANNPSIKTEVEFTLVVKKAIRITGKITSTTGKSIEGANVYFDNPAEYKFSLTGTTDAEGNYVSYVEPGSFNIEAVYNDSSSKGIYKKNITADTSFDFVLDDVYEVKITSDEDINFSDWYDEDGNLNGISGNRLFLNSGSWNLIAKGATLKDNKIYRYEAVLDATIDKDCEIKVDVDLIDVPNIDGFGIGTNALANVSRMGQYALFVPAHTTWYNFKSDFGDSDPAITIYDLQGNEIFHADDIDDEGDSNFNDSVELVGGVQYIVKVYAYVSEEEVEPSGTVTVSELLK